MHKARVLIVEDEGIVAMDLQYNLTNLGYSVCGITDSGEEAIQLTAAERPDLVMMDISLAGKMSGIEAARRIFDEYSVPVIYVTAYSNVEILEQFKNLLGHKYVFKPFSNEELAKAIKSLLDDVQDNS
ncbi:MAG: response regulator [Nitrospirota bacterium]